MRLLGIAVLTFYAAIAATAAGAESASQCTQLQFVEKSNVNIVFFGYKYVGNNKSLSDKAAKLESIFGADLAVTTLATGENGFFRLRQSQDATDVQRRACVPEIMVPEMAARLLPGQTLISYWGNLIEQGNTISVQKVCRHETRWER
jgi:hypothetical protein